MGGFIRALAEKMEIGKFTSDRPSGNTSEAIKAFVRVRPPISSEISHENCIQVPSGNDIHLKSEKYEVRCKYDCVFNELSTQEEVFQKISPLLDDILLGYNASIFAYGQTSAGKVSFYPFIVSPSPDSYNAWPKWWPGS